MTTSTKHVLLGTAIVASLAAGAVYVSLPGHALAVSIQAPALMREWSAERDGPKATTRSQAEVRKFQKQTGHVGGWAGHVVDHIGPLCAGFPDSASNMQWQTLADSYRKDVFERQLCITMTREHFVLVSHQ